MANIIRRHEGTQPAPITTRGWDPFDIMREMLSLDPLRQLGQLGQIGGGHLHPFTPQFEVRETGDRYVFKADLPGVKDADLEISLDDNRLTVSGHREMEQVNEADRFYALERTYGSFTRTFTLPSGIDPDRVTARLDNGVLVVEVPKAPEHQPRKINVQQQAEQRRGTEKNVKA
jgi:HSP20 family protein